MAHKSTTHCEHLLLTAGKSAGNLIFTFFKTRKTCVNLLDIILEIFLILKCERTHEQVVVNRELLENSASFGTLRHSHFNNLVAGSLSDILAFVENMTFTNRNKTHYRLHRCGLSCAVCTDKSYNFALINLKTDTIDRLYNSVVDRNVFNFQHCHNINLRYMP